MSERITAEELKNLTLERGGSICVCHTVLLGKLIASYELLQDELAQVTGHPLMASEICRRFNVQNCHYCDDAKCGDNTNPIFKAQQPHWRVEYDLRTAHKKITELKNIIAKLKAQQQPKWKRWIKVSESKDWDSIVDLHDRELVENNDGTMLFNKEKKEADTKIAELEAGEKEEFFVNDCGVYEIRNGCREYIKASYNQEENKRICELLNAGAKARAKEGK